MCLIRAGPNQPDVTRGSAIGHLRPGPIDVHLYGVAPSRPMANAGLDQHVSEGDTVTLNGSAHAKDPNSHLAYQWALSSRSHHRQPFQLDGAQPRLHNPRWRGLRFRVTVTNTDTGVVSDPTDPQSYVTIHVTNLPPVVYPSPARAPACGFPQQFSVAFTDPGYLNTFTASWSFGDTQEIALHP